VGGLVMRMDEISARRRFLAVAVALIAAFGGAAFGGDGAGTEEGSAAIRQLLEGQAEDWNRGDLDRFLEGYWRSPELVFQSGGDRQKGWEAVRARYRKRYQEEGKVMGRLAFSELDVFPLGPEGAFARGRWQLTMPDGTRPGGLFTLVLRKFPEGWRIVHDHTSSAGAP
jgi:ketosteroid isomerase-like protein